MKNFCLTVMLSIVLVCAAAPTVCGQGSPNGPVLVGHIDYAEGSLLRYVPENKDWVATGKDAPFGLQDALYAEPSARVEIIMPNTTMLRIGGSTQAQLLRLTQDLTEIDIASGKARFYNTSASTVIRATTPFGQVVAPAGAVFDLYVADDSVEVVAIKGAVEYVHPSGNTKYPVQPGAASLLATRSEVTSGQGMADASWNVWNIDRDRVWQNRAESRGESSRYLPPELHSEAYELEESGRWERVSYEGDYRYFWRPTYVSAGWAPYTNGRWTYWYGDNCWIPAEPFGYVTHHYGTWVYVDARRCWYWSPPMASVGVITRGPSYAIGYSWYPGRVAWIYDDSSIGWVPLAPYEPYYCHNYWGPAVVVVNYNFYDFDHHGRHHGDRHHDGDHHGDHHGKHKYGDHAVAVPHNKFYSVDNYHKAGVRSVDRATVQRSYRSSPVVNTQVLKNRSDLQQKYNFANTRVNQKPHQTVRDRIQQNLASAGREGRQPASAIMQRLERMKTGSPSTNALVQSRPQQVTDKLVPARDVEKPKSVSRFTTRELKPSGTVRPVSAAKEQTRPEPQPSQPRLESRPEPRQQPSEPSQYQRPTPPPSQPRHITAPEPRQQPSEPSQYQRPTPPSQPRHITVPEPRQQPSEPSQYQRPATPSQPRHESRSDTRQQGSYSRQETTPAVQQSHGRSASGHTQQSQPQQQGNPRNFQR